MKGRGKSEPKQKGFSLHWGSGVVEEEATFEGRYHRPALQLLKFLEGQARGGYEIRFCYYDHRGRFQRSPLILDEDNLSGLAEALRKTPKLRRLLKRLVT